MNVNCWSLNNNELRQKLVLFNKPDIVCVTETHLRGKEKLYVPGYDYYGLNSVVPPTNIRGSGGVGILMKSSLHNTFNSEICYTYNDNVIGIKLTSKDTDEGLALFCVYLPPETSKYAAGNEAILNNLTLEAY